MRDPSTSPVLIAGPQALDDQVRRVAAEISDAHPSGVTLAGLLKGSVLFLADLARAITVPCRIELLALAEFDGSTSRTRLLKGLDAPVVGADVMLVTAVVDTGLTVDFLRRHLVDQGAQQVHVATLADKPARRLLPSTPDHVAFVVPDTYLLGYGLDYRGRYRNLASLWGVDIGDLLADPDRHVDVLYGLPSRTGEEDLADGSPFVSDP